MLTCLYICFSLFYSFLLTCHEYCTTYVFMRDLIGRYSFLRGRFYMNIYFVSTVYLIILAPYLGQLKYYRQQLELFREKLSLIFDDDY